MIKRNLYLQLLVCVLSGLVLGGCIRSKNKRPALLKIESATQIQLMNEVDRLARIESMRAKMDLKFEDNSYAEQGVSENYITVDSELVVQRPASILFKVQTPVVSKDMVQMTSDGEKFQFAILEDFSGGKYKKFVSGTNNADYSILQQEIKKPDTGKKEKDTKQNVGAFSNLRPQHFTDAILVRPIDITKFIYTQSTITEEENASEQEKALSKRVLRGYYLLDEFSKNSDGSLSITRRFWFDRTTGMKLKRQQVFDSQKEVESDISYPTTGNLSDTGEYNNLPLKIEVTRPKEKYKISLTYQTPKSVTIGKPYPVKAFVLENTWNLPEVDLDQKLDEAKKQKANSGN